MTETAYVTPAPAGAQIPHEYGDHVHILSDAWALSVLARIGEAQTGTQAFHRLVRAAYARLVHAATAELRTTQASRPTRMADSEPRAAYHGAVLDPEQRVVIVDVARAGILPSLVFQEQLLEVLHDDAVRVDHLYMQRVTDAAGRVTGVDLSGSKIGGPVSDAVLFVPDPMGATGSTIERVVRHYTETVGSPRKVVAVHLMVTPEAIRRLSRVAPDVKIYALRVDRGLSDPSVLDTPLGSSRAERGLTDNQYIVPGAGGLGELLNNAFV